MKTRHKLILAIISITITLSIVYFIQKEKERNEIEEMIGKSEKCWEEYRIETDKLGDTCYDGYWDNKTNKYVQGDCFTKRLKFEELNDKLHTCIGI